MLHSCTMNIGIYLLRMLYKLPILLSCSVQKFLLLSISNLQLDMLLFALKKLLILRRYQKEKVFHFETRSSRGLNSLRTPKPPSDFTTSGPTPKVQPFQKGSPGNLSENHHTNWPVEPKTVQEKTHEKDKQ